MNTPTTPGGSRSPQNNNGETKRNLLIACAAVILSILVGWLVFTAVRASKRAEAAQIQMEQLQLDMAQSQLESDYALLNEEFAQFENSRRFIMDDSVKRELNDKYEAARVQVEKLQQELKNQKHKSAAEIAKLKDEIGTLRALLRHYVEEIDRLNKENEALRSDTA